MTAESAIVLFGSVTRFGKILTLWHEDKIFCYFLGLVSTWQHFEPTLAAIMIGIGQLFTVVKGQILKNDLAIWSHCILAKQSFCQPGAKVINKF